MAVNMGTPGWPESVKHWSNKVMLFKEMERRVKLQRSWFLVLEECCGQCQGGDHPHAENVLQNVQAVKIESQSGSYIPDILLEKRDGSQIWFEIVVTAPPSPAKLGIL